METYETRKPYLRFRETVLPDSTRRLNERRVKHFQRYPSRSKASAEATPSSLPSIPLPTTPIEVRKIPLSQCNKARGLVVVIDVLRAFTTAAYAFGAGAEEIILVSTVEEAFALKEKNPSLLLMGEECGQKIEGFDFGNSPTEIASANLQGKRLVQRTSAGTQGVIRCKNASAIYTSSFAVADATYKLIRNLSPHKVTFVTTGNDQCDEDHALADYLSEKLKKKRINPKPYLDRVTHSHDAQTYISEEYQRDVQMATKIDNFPFAMKVFDGNVLRKVSVA